MPESRRRFLQRSLTLAGAGAAYLAVGCSESRIEKKIEVVNNLVSVGDQELIPEEFKDKDTHKIVNDEIFKRLGIPPSHISYNELVTEAGIQFSVNDTTFQIGRRKQSNLSDEQMGMTYYDHKTESRYAIILRGDEVLPFGVSEIVDDTKVLSGEKATDKEAEDLKKNMSEILIKSYNQLIRENGSVGVHYSYFHFVPKATSTPKE